MKKLILSVSLLVIQFAQAQTWNLLIPSTSYDGTKLNFSGSGYNRSENKIYSLFWNAQGQLIQSFDLNNQTVQTINATNGPGELNSFTYDFENARLIAGRVGRDQLYTLPLTGGAWSGMGTGNFDSESYGSQYFYNNVNNSVGYFAGYGFYEVKNWVWENDGIQWNNILPNDINCDNFTPAKRVNGNPVLGNPNQTSVYYFSSAGNCTGSQFDQSCPFGSPWASDVGVWCWLKDIWKYDYSANSFTQILPPNSSSITLEGDLAYDYINNTFYILGGYVPSPIYDPNYATTFQNTVLRYRVGIDAGFLPLNVSGTAPNSYPNAAMGVHGAYFDALNDRIVWARFDGVYTLDLGNVGMDEQEINGFKLYPNPNNGDFTIENQSNQKIDGIELADLSGNVIYKSTDIHDKYSFNHLSAGLYIVTIYTENGPQKLRFVKR